MPKDILLLGEFSSGKSAFINLLLGVPIMPERLAATDLPVVKVHGVKPAGLWLREPDQRNPRGIDCWVDIPKDWSGFSYAEISIPDHPLLQEGLVLWDTPGINSTNPQHTRHLQGFLKSLQDDSFLVLYFTRSGLTATACEFLNAWPVLRHRLIIVANIHERRSQEDCRRIELDVKRTVLRELGPHMVHLLAIGDVCEGFNDLVLAKRDGLSDWDIIKSWGKIRIDLHDLMHCHSGLSVGAELFDSLCEVGPSVVKTPIVATASNFSPVEKKQPLAPPRKLPFKLTASFVHGIGSVNCVAFFPSQDLIATAGLGRAVRVWDYRGRKGREFDSAKFDDELIQVLAFSPDGRTIACGGSDGRLCLHDSTSGLRQTYVEVGIPIESLSFSPQGDQLAYSCSGGRVEVFHILSGSTHAIAKACTQAKAVTFVGRGESLVTGHVGGNDLRQWETESGKHLREWVNGSGFTRALVCSPNGALLAVLNNSSDINLWELTSQKCLRVLNTGNAKPMAISFHPKKDRVAVGCTDSTATLWDITTGELLQTFEGHTKPVLAVSFSRDGSILATAGLDGKVNLWSSDE
jgi:WD40 repeat protein